MKSDDNIQNSIKDEHIQENLAGTLFQHVWRFAELNSTNTQLMHAARRGEPEGTVYIAEHQTAGRGRFKRPWSAPAGKALLFSFLLCPRRDQLQTGLLTLMTALSITEAMDKFQGLPAAIKWPNVVLVNGRKVCGVLGETERTSGRGIVVIGAGINANQVASELPPDTSTPATSVAIELGHPIDRTALLIECLRRFDSHYRIWLENDDESLLNAVRLRMSTLGQPIEIRTQNRGVQGTAIDLSLHGGLVIRLESGVEREFTAPDIIELNWNL